MATVNSICESLRVTVEQDDADGHRVDRYTYECYGLTTSAANDIKYECAEAVLTVLRKWNVGAVQK
jgi:hypothetical protein